MSQYRFWPPTGPTNSLIIWLVPCEFIHYVECTDDAELEQLPGWWTFHCAYQSSQWQPVSMVILEQSHSMNIAFFRHCLQLDLGNVDVFLKDTYANMWPLGYVFISSSFCWVWHRFDRSFSVPDHSCIRASEIIEGYESLNKKIHLMWVALSRYMVHVIQHYF